MNVPDVHATVRVDGGDGNGSFTVSVTANEWVIGGAGADQMTGGAGNDVFIFSRGSATPDAPGSATDMITDFAIGGDRFDLGAFSLDLAGLQALLAASSGDRLALEQHRWPRRDACRPRRP